MQLTIYAGANTSILRLEDLSDHTGALVSDATVAAQIVNGQTSVFDGSLAAVVGTPGAYEAEIAPDPPLTKGLRLVGNLTATKGAKKMAVVLSVMVQERA